MKNLNTFVKPLRLLLVILSPTLFAQNIQWEQLNGPFGGTALSFVSTSNGEIFAGADQDQRGIYRSTDGGNTFQPKSTGLYLENRAFSWLALDDTSFIIAGTNSHIGSKVYKSKDNGESWAQIAILGGTSVAKNDSGHIYVGNTAYGQYSVSKDGGYSWVHYPSPAAFTNCIAINDSGHIFIGGNYTGYRSTDNGANWTSMSSGGLPDGINSIAFAPNGNIYAGCSREYASISGIYRSADNGDSWTAVKEGFRVYASHNIVVTNNGDVFVGSWGNGIWKSTDDGDTWNQCISGLGHFYVKSMYVTESGDLYAGLSGGGIYRSTDNGENWAQVGLTASMVKALAISPSNGFLFASVSGISRSTDSGITWEPINNGISSYDVVNSEIKNMAIKSDGTIFFGNRGYWNDYFIYRSTNNGNSWTVVMYGSSGDVSGVTVDNSNNVYVSIAQNGVFKSTNNGDNWFKIGNPPAGKLATNSSGDLFLASYGGGLWKLPAGDTVWVSLGGSYIYTFFISSNDYLYTDQARSTDNGLTWTNMPLGNMAYSYAENSQGHLFAGTFNYGSGVKRSTDYGETWEYFNTGIPTSDVRSVAVDANDYVYAGPWGYSLYKTATSTVTGIIDKNSQILDLTLLQNHPNPFNKITTITWQQSKQNHVLLTVYDFTGRKIKTLTDTKMPAGQHKITLDASELPAGVCFYQLKVNEMIETKKMIIVK